MSESQPQAQWRLQVARWSAPILATLIASSQVVLAYGGGVLNPAKRGGFGLFSTVDSLDTRIVHVHLIGPDGTKLQLNPGVVASAPGYQEVVSYPFPAALEKLAQTYASGRYTMPVERARVIVWKQTMDPKTHRIERVRLAEAEAKRTDAAGGYVPVTPSPSPPPVETPPVPNAP